MKDKAKQLAIKFLKPYALRGDSVEWMISGQGGHYSDKCHVHIGGYVWTDDNGPLHKIKRDEIAVVLPEKQCFIFPVRKLWEEALNGTQQLLI